MQFEGPLACDPSHPCPSGYECSADNLCIADPMSSMDGGAGDGGNPSGACGTTDALHTELNDSVLSWPWINDIGGAGTITPSNGALELRVPAGDAGHAVIESRGWYDLDESAINLVFREEPGPALTRLDARVLGQSVRYFTEVENGTFRAGRSAGAETSVLYESAFLPEQHLAWQIREHDGVVLFETAGPAGDWVERAMSIGSPTAPVIVTLELDGKSTITEDSSAIIESINADRTGSHCAASTVFDTFDDGRPGDEWLAWNHNGCVWLEQSGTLRFQNFTESYSDCGYVSRRLYNLLDDTLPALIFESGAGAGRVNFGLRIDADERYQFGVDAQAEQMVLAHYTDDVSQNLVTVEFAYDTHKYWRFHHQGKLLFEVSGNGVDWAVVHSVEDDRLDAVQIMLYGSGSAPGPGEAGFEQIGQ